MGRPWRLTRHQSLPAPAAHATPEPLLGSRWTAWPFGGFALARHHTLRPPGHTAWWGAAIRMEVDDGNLSRARRIFCPVAECMPLLQPCEGGARMRLCVPTWMMTMLPELFMSVPAAYWLIVRPATWTIQGALQWQPSSLSTGRPCCIRFWWWAHS